MDTASEWLAVRVSSSDAALCLASCTSSRQSLASCSVSAPCARNTARVSLRCTCLRHVAWIRAAAQCSRAISCSRSATRVSIAALIFSSDSAAASFIPATTAACSSRAVCTGSLMFPSRWESSSSCLLASATSSAVACSSRRKASSDSSVATADALSTAAVARCVLSSCSNRTLPSVSDAARAFHVARAACCAI